MLVITGIMFLDELAVLDPAAPSAGLGPGDLDQRLESVQVRSRSPLYVTHAASCLLDQAAWVHVECEQDARQVRGEFVERHHAGVGHPLADGPLDPLIGPLSLDLCGEFLGLGPDLGGE